MNCIRTQSYLYCKDIWLCNRKGVWPVKIIIIIVISPTASKPRRNMGRPLQGRNAIAVQLSLPLSVKYISIAILESLKRHLEGVSWLLPADSKLEMVPEPQWRGIFRRTWSWRRWQRGRRMSMISVVARLGQLPLNVTRHGGNEGKGHVPPCRLADRLWTECDVDIVEQEANEDGRG